MTIEATIQDAMKAKKAVLGFRQAIKLIKVDEPKAIVIAKNIPERMRKEIEHNAKISRVTLEIFSGSSKDLGVICGKPYPVSTIVIKK
ncbi:MAG TPA: 50S ribosomal protein L30e [archaeon]|nr:50S ribosomal protein L30e [archaeon]